MFQLRVLQALEQEIEAGEIDWFEDPAVEAVMG
jgi:hypothetical protein